MTEPLNSEPVVRHGYSSADLRLAEARGREAGLLEAAKRVQELGEELYPEDTFVGGAAEHARHLCKDVLPDEIKWLIDKDKGAEVSTRTREELPPPPPA